ncbi:MAG: hypothetical protein RR406_00245 [Bacilli bacterium]
MDDFKKVGYRPNLQYTDEYEADIDFKLNNEIEDNDDDNSLIDDLLEQGDALDNMIDKLPGFIGDFIKDPLDPIISFVKDELYGKDLERVPVELDWTYDPNIPGDSPDVDTSEKPGPDDQEELDPWGPEDDIIIKIENHTKTEVIEKEYVKNVYDIFNDYYTNLHNIVSNFWSGFLYSIMNKDTSEIKTIMDNIILSSSDIKDNKKHLLDSSVRSEINRDMKFRYYANNFDAEGSIKHLKNFKAMYELRIRYSKIDKNENPVSRADQMSNNILKGMSMSYDSKYDKAFENLHRYLKSSNTVLNDSLQAAMQSMKSKQTLIDTKGVKN